MTGADATENRSNKFLLTLALKLLWTSREVEPMNGTQIPTRKDRLRLGVEANKDEITIKHAYAGRSVTTATWSAIARAARKLGLPPPPLPGLEEGDAA